MEILERFRLSKNSALTGIVYFGPQHLGILTSLNYPSQPQAIRSTRALIQCFFSLYPQFRMTAQPQPPISLSLVHDSIHQPLMSSFSETDYLQFLPSHCAPALKPRMSIRLSPCFRSLSINLAWRARQATISSIHSLPRQQEATLFIRRGSSLRLHATTSRRQIVIFLSSSVSSHAPGLFIQS